MTATKLKPCPFCGRKPRYVQYDSRVALECATASCPGGPSTGCYADRDYVARRWNTRKRPKVKR